MSVKETSTIGKKESLIDLIKFMGEGGNYNRILHDFMLCAFEELLGSTWYAALDSARRKDLFKQYHELYYVLSNIDEFVRAYPDSDATESTGS